MKFMNNDIYEKLVAQFMATFNHQVNNLLHDMYNDLDVLHIKLEKLGVDKSGDLRSQIDRLTNTAENLSYKWKSLKPIITSTLDRPIVFNVHDCISEYIDLLVGHEHVSVFKDTNGHLIKDLTLFGSKSAFVKIIVPIVLNSLESLSYKRLSNKIISVRITKDLDDVLEIKIKDNGIGVHPENLIHLFEEGFTTKLERNGYGLYIAKTLIESEFNGSITLESEHKISATVKIRIPNHG